MPTQCKSGSFACQGCQGRRVSAANRLEHAPRSGEPGRYHKIEHDAGKLQEVLLESFIDSRWGKPPSRLVLDIDSTDDEVHGSQEGRSYHGYYHHYCFLPLYICCGGHPLFALLRPGNADPAGGVTEPLGRIVARLRERWPGVEILVRADSAYAREELLAWCEDNGVGYCIGLARNSRLHGEEPAVYLIVLHGKVVVVVFKCIHALLNTPHWLVGSAGLQPHFLGHDHLDREAGQHVLEVPARVKGCLSL